MVVSCFQLLKKCASCRSKLLMNAARWLRNMNELEYDYDEEE